MNIQPLAVDQAAAMVALKEYRDHRNIYDKRDQEIARIYRAIARGNVVIDALAAIRRAGVDDLGRPRLAIMRAVCEPRSDVITRINGKYYARLGDDSPRQSVGLNYAWEEALLLRTIPVIIERPDRGTR